LTGDERIGAGISPDVKYGFRRHRYSQVNIIVDGDAKQVVDAALKESFNDRFNRLSAQRRSQVGETVAVA